MSTAAQRFMLILVIVLVVIGGVVARSIHHHPSTTTTTTTTNATSAPSNAVWPYVASSSRFGDPEPAATVFAHDYLGFSSPVASPAVGSSNGFASVRIRPNALGMVTTVRLERWAPNGTWWVISASTPTIVVTTPRDEARVASPLTVSGRSLAYEGVVNVDVRQDGTLTPLARTTVMGGGSAMAPFHGTIHYATPTASAGAVVFRERSAKNGGFIAATVVRVTFK